MRTKKEILTTSISKLTNKEKKFFLIYQSSKEKLTNFFFGL